MRYKWHDIPSLLRTPIGRMQCIHGFYNYLWPILSRLAIPYRQTFRRNTRISVVVGSLGKTTTTRAIATALNIPLLQNSLHNFLSYVAGAIFRIRLSNPHAVIEVGIDRPRQMAAYARMIRPNITVVTSIGSEHNRLLGTLEVTRREKAEMVRILPESGIAVLNGDDPNVLWMKDQTKVRTITFGMNESNNIFASDIRLNWPKGTRFKLHLDGKTYGMEVRLIGQHMVYPILAAVAVAHAEGIPLEQSLPALEMLPPTPGRMQPVRLENGAIVLRDELKSALETIEVALDVLSEIPARRRIVVFGDVTEPKGRYGPLLQHLGERIGKIFSKAVFICHKKQARSYAAGAIRGGLPRSAIFRAGTSVFQVVEQLRDDLREGDVVLIKGRFDQRLERIALALSGQIVRCNIPFCDIKVTVCEHCPMLERGWTRRL